MKKTIPLIIIISYAFVFLSGCSGSETESSMEKNPIKLVRIDSVVLEQGEPLFGKFFEYIKISMDGQYWLFADRIRNQLFIFNNDGSFHSVIGERGKGPNGIQQIAGFDINYKDEVFIFDSAQLQLKIFDITGQILHSTNYFEETTFIPTSFNLLWYKGMIVSSIFESEYLSEPHKSKLVAVMDLDGNVNTLIGKHDPFTKEDYQFTFNTETAFWKEKNLLYTNLRSSPYYQVYDLSTGNRVLYKGHKSKNFKLPNQEIDAYMPASEKMKRLSGTSGVKNLYLTDDYLIQHLQVLTKEWFDLREISAKQNYLVIYDKFTNEFNQEVKISHVPIGVHNNQLYVVEDFNPDNYTIGIYEFITD